jgi:hypothetical protein
VETNHPQGAIHPLGFHRRKIEKKILTMSRRSNSATMPNQKRFVWVSPCFKNLEQALATPEAGWRKTTRRSRLPCINRGTLPLHLPREPSLFDIDQICCGALEHHVGEDVSEGLDVIWLS